MFTLQLQAIDHNAMTFAMTFVVDGPLTLGGGVPRVTIEQMTYTMALIDNDLPGTMRISAEVQGAADSLSLEFDLEVDD